MVSLDDIQNYALEIARKFDPDRIVLFGSHADGRATDDSDVDLLVIMKHSGRDIEQAFAIRKAIDRTFPLDLVVRTPGEMKSRVRHGDSFLGTIEETGRTLYDRRDQRMDR